MIESVEEYNTLLERLRSLKKEDKLSNNMLSELNALESVEGLVKKLAIPLVSNQRELLIAFFESVDNKDYEKQKSNKSWEVVDHYLKAINYR